MLKLGIFGGTFNPIHIGHLIVAQSVLEDLSLDKIIFIPTGNPPHKNFNMIESGFRRLDMITRATKSNEKFDISDIEVVREGVTYTFDTLIKIRQVFNKSEINFIIGYDTLLDMKNWYNIHEVVKLAKFIVVNRNEQTSVIKNAIEFFKKGFGGEFELVNIPNIDVSSSDIRKRIIEGKDINYMVTKPVYDYIIDNNLYRGDFI
ncbi:MAG: nicotinate-nucleotide adenylyltransferase [Clostridium sp.]